MSKLLPLHDLLPLTVDGLIFSPPLIPGVLSGTKTVTRRMSRKWMKRKVGELLYLKEVWAPCDTMTAGHERDPAVDIAYRADLSALILRIDGTRANANCYGWNWDRLTWKGRSSGQTRLHVQRPGPREPIEKVVRLRRPQQGRQEAEEEETPPMIDRYPHAPKCSINSGWCSECGHSPKSHTPCLASTVNGLCGCKQFRTACDCGATSQSAAFEAGKKEADARAMAVVDAAIEAQGEEPECLFCDRYDWAGSSYRKLHADACPLVAGNFITKDGERRG